MVMLMGPGGTGKTYALRTLAARGIICHIVALDTTGLESIADLPDEQVHWHRIPPTGKSWNSMITEAERLGSLHYEGIARTLDPNKGKQQRWINVLKTLANFKCDRCGKEFGEIDKWPTNHAIIIDHFTELCQASKEWAVGEKLVLHEGEWQVAQNNVENLVRQLYTVPRCWRIVLGHLDKEIDIVLGGQRVMAAALGKKLAPKLPPLFSDVIRAIRNGKAFEWTVLDSEADLKTRNLPIEAGLRPDFGQIIDCWKSRGGIIES